MNTPNNNGQNLDNNQSEVSDSQIINGSDDNLKYINQIRSLNSNQNLMKKEIIEKKIIHTMI